MPAENTAPDGQSAKSLTVDQAAGAFLSLLTPPKGPEDTQEPKETTDAPVEPTSPEEPPAPVEQPESVEPAEPPETELAPELSGDKRTVEEMKRDLLADYTRKTMEVADQRKAFEAESTDLRAKRHAYAERLTALDEALKSLDAAEPDAATLETLRKENPAEYAAVRADLQANRDRRTAVQAERERVRQEEQAEQAKLAAERFVTERDKLLAAVPEWKDPTKAEAASRELYATAQQYGFQAADIAAGMHDHKIVLLLRDAMAYRKLKAQVPDTKKKVEALKTATPGARTTADRGAGEKKALDRLSQSGRKDDAAAVFLERSKQRT